MDDGQNNKHYCGGVNRAAASVQMNTIVLWTWYYGLVTQSRGK